MSKQRKNTDDANEALRRREQSNAAKFGTRLTIGGGTLNVVGSASTYTDSDIIQQQMKQMELEKEERARIEREAVKAVVDRERWERTVRQRELEARFHRGDPDVYMDFERLEYAEVRRHDADIADVPCPPKNALKATVHKAGHFPTEWMIEAYERGQQSDVLITIQIEKDGVVVIGEEGEAYETIQLSWQMMEKAQTNPVVIGIETVEKHLATLANLKSRVKAGKK